MKENIKERLDNCIMITNYICEQKYLSHPHMVWLLTELKDLKRVSIKKKTRCY